MVRYPGLFDTEEFQQALMSFVNIMGDLKSLNQTDMLMCMMKLQFNVQVSDCESKTSFTLSFLPHVLTFSPPSADEGEDERGGMEHPFLRVWSRCLYVPNF